MLYLMKYEDSQQFGGREEGGWWYNLAVPQWERGIPLPKFILYPLCRWLNRREQAKPHEYGYTSVLSYREEFFSYGAEDNFIPATPTKPHYE